MFADLQKRAKGPSGEPTPVPAQPPSSPESETPPAQTPAGDAPASSQDSPAPAAPAAKPKVNPWKLVDEWKGKAAQLEKDLAAAKTSIVPEEERKTITERLTKAEQRAKELEDHIRFVDYKKSDEFRTKYQEPYEKAWTKAMSELKEISVVDPGSEQARPATADDLLQLVNLPLGKAREVANAVFGDFADDVMAHRKDIRNLFEAQNTALSEAEKNGAERIKSEQEKAKTFQSQVTKFVSDAWDVANQSALNDEKYGKFFKPIDGNQEINQRLAKGKELVDRAFSENPLDPKLTPDERRAVVQRHAAVRNRAMAFGRVLYELNQSVEKIAALEKELSQFKSSEPTTGGGRQQATEAPSGSAFSQVMQDLRRRAK